MFKRHFFALAAVALVAVMAVAGILRLALADDSGGQGRGGPGGPGGRGGGGQAVSVAVVEARGFSDTLDVLGVARGRRSVNVTSNTSELVTRVLFRDGQSVRAGQALVELQAREQDAGLIEAQARLAQAERDWQRWQELADRGIAPRVNAEQARTAYETAQAGVRAAQARVGDRVIRAPFAGVVGLSDVQPGTLISPGTVVATLDDLSVIRVDFPVPERFLSSISNGQPVRARPDALDGVEVSGRIATLDTRINEQTRAVTARAEFPNPGGRIRPGMMMRVSIVRGERSSLSLPETAILFQGGDAFVYRIIEREGQSSAQRVQVTIGVNEGGRVEILSGLDANDRVVATGLNRIQPGSPVQPLDRQAAQGGRPGAGGNASVRGNAGQSAP
ncbi:MAG: efflux RND transporter periplasmic adaptor subunit [Brevundimonas sp.]|uniref:efflux RND transporter periplasmic adaptor subunit n=1 Tax=Brevundimonas sp. TaxID=1871086 RepID=UPI00391B4FAA